MQIKGMGGFLDGIDGDRLYRLLQTGQTIIDGIDFIDGMDFIDGIDYYRQEQTLQTGWTLQTGQTLQTGGRKYAPKGNGKDEKEKKQSALPYLIIDWEGAYHQKLIKATLLVAWGLQNQ